MVQTWEPKETPEYRGFRCANCQRYIRKAWHHWCESDHYKTPVHLCNKCESSLESFKPKIIGQKASVDITKFKPIQELPDEIGNRLRKIVDEWDTKSQPVYEIFTCDCCHKNMYKAYHFWFRIGEVLSEAHFCKKCGDRLGLEKPK